MFRSAFVQFCCLVWPLLASGLVYECNFDGTRLNEQPQRNLSSSTSQLEFIKQLPPTRTVSHSCIVTTGQRESLLRVKAKAFGHLGEKSGSLHMSAFGTDESSLGHMDVPMHGSGDTLTLCPQPSSRKYLVLFTGTPNLSYAAELSDNESTITVNEEVTFEAKKTATVFKFTPNQGVSHKQLDITVESSSSMSAYLKVSQRCEDVAKDIKHLDYEGKSLRLSFAEKGRITLSKATKPPLVSGSVWFIGVALKNPEHSNDTKPVTLTLNSSFDYNYTKPFYFLIGLSLFGGILVSLWALFCFRDPYILVQEDNPIDDSLSLMSNSSSTFSTFKDNLKSLFSSCWRTAETGEADELRPLIRGTRDKKPLSWKELFVAMKDVMFRHWFARGPKTFSYTTCIVGFVLLVGAFQFVFEDWKLMIEDGDRDKCYYNDFCYRVSDYDIPFNLMISNLAYIIHGLILAWSVWVMEAELLAWCNRLSRNRRSRTRLPTGQVELPNHCMKCPNINAHLAKMSVPDFRTNREETILLHAEAHKRKFSFSIGYAFAWALIFEGCFSMLYHFCPTKLTFQFDTAFMFVIAGLIVLSLYNGISYKECTTDGKTQLPVQSSNFFLYFIVPLYVFNYFAALYSSNSNSLGLAMQVLFIVCLVLYYIFIFSWAGINLFNNVSSCSDLKQCDVLTKTVIFIAVLAIVSIVLPLLFKNNIPNIFLFACILTSLLAISGKILIQFWKSERSHWTIQKVAFRIFQGSYVLVTLGVMGTAVWIFTAKATTDKTKTPELSRDLNQDCAVLDFFDYHDLWHIMSSFALLMGAYLVLYISD